MKQVTTNLYSFDELSDEAKEKALDHFRLWNVDYEWWEFIFEDFRDRHSNAFEIGNIYFSGFASQGDGAMFEYSFVSYDFVDEFLLKYKGRKEKVSEFCTFGASGTHTGRYYHFKNCDHRIEVYFDTHNRNDLSNVDQLVYELSEEFEEFVKDRYSDLCEELYRTLEKEYDYLISDEAVAETLLSNNYQFTQDGEIY